MTPIRSYLAVAAVVVLAAAASAPLARAQAPSSALHLLDVPYLPQSEALCGGAAVAMVMRYWGATGVYAETFADLVDPGRAGIRGEDLIRALQSRHWEARSFAGDAALVQSHLGAGRPVVALIEDRPGRFHYVVLVGWAAGRVILHDPARAPFRVLDEAGFLEAWSKSGRWSLLALPVNFRLKAEATSSQSNQRTDDVASLFSRKEPVARITTSCDGIVAEGVRLAGTGNAAEARVVFETAAQSCPSASVPLRELAGLRALQSDWRGAADYARQAVARDENDHHAWRILATSRYLTDDFDGALTAWNRVREPVIDLVTVTGLERTRYQVAARATGLVPEMTLTVDALRTARRRLAELPAATTARVAYRPREDGRAVIDAVVLERPLVPRSVADLALAGVRALSDREVRLHVASPTGEGELWSASWRWWERRPRVSFGFAAPAPTGGVWRIEAFGERQTYADADSEIVESRRSAALSASNWTAGGLRWEAAAGIDRWHGGATSVTLSFELRQRLFDDRFTVGGHASGSAGDIHASAAGTHAEWRSAIRNEGSVWLARGGVEAASAGSPLAFWPGAGTGQGRDVLLRAHPLLDDGRIRGVFGRTLFHAAVEWRLWQRPVAKVVRFAPALFADAARVWRGLDTSNTHAHIDAGVGLRVAAPGSGVIRVDLARGLRDGEMALSIGWTR